MSFYSATVANDAAISTTMVTQLESMLAAHSAWQFVETYTTGGYETRTWKNLGTVNSWGQDWYLHIFRSTTNIGTTTITFRASEGYSTSTHLATRLTAPIAISNNTSTPDATYSSYYGTTAAAPYTGSGGNAYGYPTLTPSVASTYYAFLVTKNGIWATDGTSSKGLFIGLFEPFWGNQPTEFPLMVLGAVNNSPSGAFSRQPTATTAAYFSAIAGVAYTPTGGSLGTTPVATTLYNNGVLGARMVVMNYQSQTTGVYRGLHYDTLLMPCDIAVTIGDTVTYNSQTWVVIGKANSSVAVLVNTQAA